MSKNRNVIVCMITAAALLVGFALGRVSAGTGSRSTGDVSVASVSEETGGSESIAGESEGNTSADALSSEESGENAGDVGSSGSSDGSTVSNEDGTVSSGESEGDEDEKPGVSRTEDLNRDDLVDAADADYSSASSTAASSGSTFVTHEAHTDITEEATTVDPTTIENVTTINEAPLPDGVASTLYAKTGNQALFQIVVLGDSQFANFTDQHGMAYLMSQKLHANVYNLAIGGKCASVDREEQQNNNTDPSTWEETCGVNMVKAVCGMADADKVFSGFEYQKNVFDSCDFSKTDIFVLEFGVNDFLADHQMADQEDLGSYFTTFGAFETMVLDIRNTYPDAQILICMPTYAQFWQSGTGEFLGDSNIVYNSYGTLFNYAETISHIAGGHHNTSTVNAYENADINAYTASDDLLDGIHLTDAGRVKYVNLLSRVALRAMGYDIGEGVDPDTVDWISQKPLAN